MVRAKSTKIALLRRCRPTEMRQKVTDAGALMSSHGRTTSRCGRNTPLEKDAIVGRIATDAARLPPRAAKISAILCRWFAMRLSYPSNAAPAARECLRAMIARSAYPPARHSRLKTPDGRCGRRAGNLARSSLQPSASAGRGGPLDIGIISRPIAPARCRVSGRLDRRANR